MAGSNAAGFCLSWSRRRGESNRFQKLTEIHEFSFGCDVEYLMDVSDNFISKDYNNFSRFLFSKKAQENGKKYLLIFCYVRRQIQLLARTIPPFSLCSRLKSAGYST